MRKVNEAASELARKRWKGTSAEQRREQLKKAWAARSAAAAARREAKATEDAEATA